MKIVSFAVATASLIVGAPSVASSVPPMQMEVDFELSQEYERPLTNQEQTFLTQAVAEAYHQLRIVMDTTTEDDQSIGNIKVVGQAFVPSDRRTLYTETIRHFGTVEHDMTASSGTVAHESTTISSGTVTHKSTASSGTVEQKSTASAGTVEQKSTASAGTVEHESTASAGTAEHESTASSGTIEHDTTASAGTVEHGTTAFEGTVDHDMTASSGKPHDLFEATMPDDLMEVQLSYDCNTNCRKLLLKNKFPSRRSLLDDGHHFSASSPFQLVWEETTCSLLRNSHFDIFSSVHGCKILFTGLDDMLDVRHFEAEILLEADDSTLERTQELYEGIGSIIADTYNAHDVGGSDYISDVTLKNATLVDSRDERRKLLGAGDENPLLALTFDIPTTMWKDQDCEDPQNSASLTCIDALGTYLSSPPDGNTTSSDDSADDDHRNLGNWVFQAWYFRTPEGRKQLYYECVYAREKFRKTQEDICKNLFAHTTNQYKSCIIQISVDEPRC